MQPSIVGFKYPHADLHRKSPKILAISAFIITVMIALGLNIPLIQEEVVQRKVTPPPVVIQLENIPETTQQAAAPAPSLGMPLEVGDEIMLDDITIEDTTLDFEMVAPADVKPVIFEEELVEETGPAEEEVFEFFAVEEQPVRIREVPPEYPEDARRAGIQGTVYVRALVGPDGGVELVEILKGPELLREAAIAAASATPFTPAKQNGMPVRCWVQMRFNFQLEG